MSNPSLILQKDELNGQYELFNKLQSYNDVIYLSAEKTCKLFWQFQKQQSRCPDKKGFSFTNILTEVLHGGLLNFLMHW